MAGRLRRAAIAGSWYSGDAGELGQEIDEYLTAVTGPAPQGRLVALVSPHAGFFYSGAVAAYGYSLLKGRRDLSVVLVGPAHRTAFAGIAIWGRGAWRTPLGEVPIDEELASALMAAQPAIVDAPAPHIEEHCLEIQLPFLQHIVPGVRIVPLLMGSQSRTEVDQLAAGLSVALAGRAAIMVASSDLSHYHPAPVAERLDRKVTGAIAAFDPEALMRTVEESHEHACGGGPIVAVMRAAAACGANEGHVLRYADSGDAGEHDKSRVVGYVSAAFVAREGE
jgi:MEMO1 family protein